MREWLYAICLLGGFCLLIKALTGYFYKRLIQEAGQMGKSENSLMKALIRKFEACYELKMGVKNVGIFVDKYLSEYRVGGIHIYKWEVLGDAVFGTTVLASLLASLYVGFTEYDTGLLLEFLLVEVSLCGAIVLADIFLNLRRQKKQLSTEIRDYLENVYKPRLENGTFHSQEMEQYHREYFDEERAELEEVLTSQAQEEQPVRLQFTEEEEAVIREVLQEYMA